MSSDLDICEPPLKMERLDDELEMVNYEMPMQIYVPHDANDEIDPLMPIGTNDDPLDNVRPSGPHGSVGHTTSDVEIKAESEEIESGFPKINSVVPNFLLPTGQMSDSLAIENVESLAMSGDAEFTPEVKGGIYQCVNENADVEEITIEPKSEEVSWEGPDPTDCSFRLVVGARGPEIQQISRPRGLTKDQRSSALAAELMRPLETRVSAQLRVPDRVVDGVQKIIPHGRQPPIQASRSTSNLNALPRQDPPCSAKLSPTVSTNRWDNFVPREPPQAEISQDREIQSTSAQTTDNRQPTVWSLNSFPSRSLPSATAVPAVPTSGKESAKNSSTILEPMSVSRLLENPFSSGTWTSDQRSAIIKLSRPTPEIDMLWPESANRFYTKIPWLCGSSSLRKFFCWPCLLFFYSSAYTQLLWSISATMAFERGFGPLCKAHESVPAHLAAEKLLKNWLQNASCPPSSDSNNKLIRNLSIIEKVRKNRELLSLLVQSVCYLKKENHNAQLQDYADCFSDIVPFNCELQESLKEFQGGFTEESSLRFVFKYAPQVEYAVEKCLKSRISDEIQMAQFVTLFLEDLSSIVDDSNVAVIAHFVDRTGEVQERIIEIDEIGYDRSASAVFMLFQRVVFQLGLRMKVAGFTYSSTLVHPSDITDFNERVERLCPTAKFFHYQGHNLMGLLFGALSHLNRLCRNFFQMIIELQGFFKKHLIPTFHHFEQLNEPDSGSPNLSYDFDYGFITTLKRSYATVLETFLSIATRPEEWESDISSQVPIFMSFLNNRTTRFMVVLISQLNLAIMDVTSALQGKIDTAEWKLLIQRAIGNLATIKSFGFYDVHAASLNIAASLVEDGCAQSSSVPPQLVTVFHDVINTATEFLRKRFDTDDFGYVDLETVAADYYSRLRLSSYDVHKFRSQIQFLAKEPMIKDKCLAEALKQFRTYNLAAAIPESASFLDFSMTIPSSRSSLSCPAVERILHQPNRSGKQIFSENLIWMEKELLGDVLRDKPLCEAIIDVLVTDKRMIEFSYERSG